MAVAWLPLAIAQSEHGPNADQSAFSSSSLATRNNDSFADRFLALAGPAKPKRLTEKERFQQYALDTAGPFPLFGEAVGAGLSQWMNSPKEWGQGWGAFGKRYASDLAYNAVRQTIAYGVSTVFHEDYRYFASVRQGFWPRAGHALVSTFTARHPDGRDTFSMSSVTGVAGASAISSIWGPSSTKGVENIAANAGISFAVTAGLNVAREFLPDILHKHRPTN